MLNTLKAVPYWKSEYKLSFDQFSLLVAFLSTTANKTLIETNEAMLTELPFNEWLEKLTTLQSASNICDVDSAQHRLNQLCDWYGPLLKSHLTDLRLGVDTRYQRTLH